MNFSAHRSRRRRVAKIGLPVALALVLSSCQARPGDAPTVEEPPSPAKTTASSTADIPDQELREINIGVDNFSGNLNPHLVGNLGQSTMAVADLTLPSAYNRVGDKWLLNEDLLSSVDLDDPDAPQKITYHLRPQAQWSDGTPISGSDFQYLWGELRSQRIAENAAQYNQITSVKVSAGGKKVTVEFEEAQESWHQLFRHLLPSHIYRAEGQRFATMMDERSVASGGVYRVHSIDAGRGIVELHRNDRYWGSSPAVTDRLILRAVPDVHTGAQMLRAEQLQMYAAYPAGLAGLTLDQVPELKSAKKKRQVQLNFAINLESERMREKPHRQAALASLNAQRIAQIVAQNQSATPPEWVSSSGEKLPEAVAEQFKEEPFTIGAPENNRQATIAARTAADQLTAHGIPARALTVDPQHLIEELIPDGEVDASVLWARSADTQTDMANQFGCVNPEMLGHSDRREAEEKGEGGASPEASTTSATTAAPSATHDSGSTEATATGTKEPGEEKGKDSGQQRTFGANITGLCAAEIDDAIGQVGGEGNQPWVIDQVLGLVQQQAVILPLLKDEQRYAVNPEELGPAKPLGHWAFDPYSGVFIGASQWARNDGEDTDAKGESTKTDER